MIAEEVLPVKRMVPRWAVCLFFAVTVLLGLITANDYGPSWDELDEMDILRMNLWEYARAFGMDESAFEQRAAREDTLTISRLTPISQSIEQDHGAAAMYPLAGVVMSDAITEGQRSALWHAGIPVVLMDANDLQRDQLGKCSCFPLTDEQIQDAMADNPSGQGDELTPLILIRPVK